MATELSNILAVMTTETRRVLVPGFEMHFKGLVIDIPVRKAQESSPNLPDRFLRG